MKLFALVLRVLCVLLCDLCVEPTCRGAFQPIHHAIEFTQTAPPAISGHQKNYFLWGPRGYTGESMIVMCDRQDRLEKKFASVRKVAHVAHPYAMPYEHIDIFYCQGFKYPLAAAWEKIKNWH